MNKKTTRGFFVFLIAICAIFSMSQGVVLAQDGTPVVRADLAGVSLEELVKKAWAASNKGDYAEIEAILLVAKNDEATAISEHVTLSGFPLVSKMAQYKTMNDYATLLFIQAEGLMHQGRNEQAIAAFEDVIKNFPYTQCWDPSRGSYWSIAEKSKESVCVIKGGCEQDQAALAPKILPQLATPGQDAVIDYTKYGTFTGIGTRDYKYTVGNPNLLARAAGEGVFPNTGDILKNPRYKQAFKEGRLNGSHWDLVNTNDLEAAYFKWATAPEDPGVKLFYTAIMLEKSEMYFEAIKAYHALVVHFPKSVGWTYWHTPWYPAQAAVGKIKSILRLHPELNLEYTNASVLVENAADNDPANDVFFVSPGVISEKKAISAAKKSAEIKKLLSQVEYKRGGKKAWFVRYASGHWQMFVDGKPYMMKGVTYSPTKIGQSPDKETMANWMYEDNNQNGLADGPYDAWVDKNLNNVQDADEPVVGDFQLMKEMGVNTMRYYHNYVKGNKVNKELFREMFERYGIRVLMGDFLGKYAIGSGADWSTGTDYENPEHRANMLASVEKMVREFKDEPYILMWVLGNENNYGAACNADKKPEAYYTFVNEVIKRIKEIDPDHPVALCNGDTLYIDKVAKYAPEVDAYGGNVYRGDYGFGAYWDEVKHSLDRPAFITEYGCPAYSKMVTLAQADGDQARWHRASWLDVEANAAGGLSGSGNAVGAIVFAWLDEWWKNYEPARHDTKADVKGPFPGGYYYEEWFGLISQGDGKSSPFLRQLRQSYFTYKDLWNKTK